MADLILMADGCAVVNAAGAWQVLPTLRCARCQGDRPVMPLAAGAYRCSACGMLYDPSEPSC